MATPSSDYLIKAAQFTTNVHRTEYPAINPSIPKNSQAGKVVTLQEQARALGESYGLVPAFARAGVKGIALVARNAQALGEVAEEVRKINSAIQVLEVAADITNKTSVDQLFVEVRSTFGNADVLVNNSEVLSELGHLRDAPKSTWWRDFEVNVKGTFLITQGFLKLIGTTTVSTGAALGIFPQVSAYSISKLATLQLGAYVAAENANITSITIHPGIIKTTMVPDTSPFSPFADDDASLSGGLAVWLATHDAKFLNGRYVNANWDVDDLIAKTEEIVSQNELVLGLKGKFGAAQFE